VSLQSKLDCAVVCSFQNDSCHILWQEKGAAQEVA
jgi:hypothetical protein